MKKVVVLLTACLLALCTVLSVAAQTTERVVGYNDLNYATSANGAVTVQMGDVLSLLGVSVTDAEKDYIRYHFDGQCALYYTRPDAYVENDLTTYDAQTRRLELVVQDDFHENQDNYLIWVPVTATIGETTAEFAPATDLGGQYYRAVFENMDWAASMDVSIDYRADLTLTADTLNDFINFAYDGAVELTNDKLIYDQSLAAYEQSVIEWKQYNEDKARYDDYLDQVALYRDYLAYQAYLAAMAEYRAAYDAYLTNKQAWDNYLLQSAKYNAYVYYRDIDYPVMIDQYRKDMETVNYQLYMLSLLEEVDPKAGVSFVEMMIDDRVAQKIAEYESIITVIPGVKQSTIKQITDSTAYLKVFCATYSNYTKDQDKYNYYIKEQKNFSFHLKQLYESTLELYKIDKVYSLLQKTYPDYVDRMVCMMGSLYVQMFLFDDTRTLDINKAVEPRTNKTAAQLVDASVRPASDTNKATPLTYWPLEPIDPDTYEVKQEPVAPDITLEDPAVPQKPVYGVIKNEAELEPNMQDPGHMDAPVQPAPKPEPPARLNWDAYQQALYEAYAAQQLAQRPLFQQDQILSLSASANSTVYLDAVDIRYFVEFFNTDEQSTPLGRSEGVRPGEAATIPASAKNPTKAADVRYTYEFTGWVDANQNPVDLTNVTENMKVYASYRAIPRVYRVTWIVEGVRVEQNLEYGEMPTYEGTPTKAEDVRYTYTFSGWDKQPVAVTGDATYVAEFEATEKRYQVTFHMGDGTSIQKEYKYGWSLAEAVSSIRTPFIEPTAQHTYTFVGWKDAQGTLYTDKAQLPALTENMTFTAEFTQTVNTYTVTWMVDGVATQGTWEYGQTPTFGATPFKETDERYHYTFTGWDQEIATVTADATYVAQFDKQTRYYRVTFIIEGKEFPFSLAYDEMPAYGEIPQKESDVQYHYTFMGWDTEPSAVRGDAVYTAQFLSTLRKYPVTFVVGDTELTVDVDYGKIPEYTGQTPTKPEDLEFNYEFAGWDKEIVAVDGSEAIYTAVFTAIPLIPEEDGVSGALSIAPDGGFVLDVEGEEIDLALIFDKAGKEGAPYLHITFGNAHLLFSKAQIDAFYLLGESIADVSLVQTMYQGRVAYRVEMLDQEGQPVAYLVTEFTVRIPCSSTNTVELFRVTADGQLVAVDAQLKDGYLEFETMELATFVIMEKYRIEKAPLENGTVDVIDQAYPGDTITVTPSANEGYLLQSVTVTCNGEQIQVDLVNGVYTFIMPEGNVQVGATFQIVEGGSGAEVIVGVVTALLIVLVGIVIAIILYRRKAVKA